MTPSTPPPNRAQSRAARLAGWLPAFFAAATLLARLGFILTLGLFKVNPWHHAAALALQVGLCGALAWLARSGRFVRLGHARWSAQMLAMGALALGCAGWLVFTFYLLEPADLIFEAAWTKAFALLIVAALWPRVPWPQLALSVATCAMLVVAAEWLLGMRARFAPTRPLLDYPDVCLRCPPQPLGEAGSLRPGLNVRVRSPFGPQRWITNAQGFRGEREFTREPAPGVLRVLYIGDSYTAGYRTDQARFSGAVLERMLNKSLAGEGPGRFRRAEVMVANTETAIQAAYYLQRTGLAWRPHLVLHGLCLGNDMTQAFMLLQPGSFYDTAVTSAGLTVRERLNGSIGLHAARAVEKLMPAEAYRPGNIALARLGDALATRASLSALGQALQVANSALVRWPIMVSYAEDGKYHLHLFDQLNGLAFCLKRPPAEIEEAYQCEERSLAVLREVCARRGVPLLVALYPMRYAVADGEWRRVAGRYALAPERFDPATPARRMREFCGRVGIPCEDLSAPLRAGGGGACYLPLGDMHWGDRGHEVAGRALAARVMRMAGAGR